MTKSIILRNYRSTELLCQASCNNKSTINHSHPTPTPYYSCYQTIQASSNESSKNQTSECLVADTLSFSDVLNKIAVIDVLSASLSIIKDQGRCPIAP